MTRIERIAACHPAAIILREKDMTPEEYEVLAKEVMAICRQYSVKCILHSFVDVALRLQCESVHLPLHLLREMSVEQKKCFDTIGASCHSLEDALEAEKLGCTYITAGHIFETDCKKGLPGRGLEFLHSVTTGADIPVYAIGGIDHKNVSSVRKAGVEGVCLMSSLMTCDNVDKLMKLMGKDLVK